VQVSEEIELSLAGRGPCVLNFTLLSSAGSPDELIVVMVEDVTDRKQAELAREREQRSAASRAIIAALLHELNQPLTVVMVRANLLRMANADGSLSPEDLGAGLEDILEQANLCSEKLAKAERLREFVDEPYTDGTPDLRIVDFDLSADAEQQRTRILVIESSTVATDTLVEAGDAHLETISVADIGEANEKLTARDAGFDVVVVDLDLVDREGGTLPEFFTSTTAAVLAVTSDPGSDLTSEVVSSGALNVLTKPLTGSHLTYAVQRALRHRQVHKTPPPE
jgi:CheY-like chemotaxis protein